MNSFTRRLHSPSRLSIQDLCLFCFFGLLSREPERAAGWEHVLQVSAEFVPNYTVAAVTADFTAHPDSGGLGWIQDEMRRCLAAASAKTHSLIEVNDITVFDKKLYLYLWNDLFVHSPHWLPQFVLSECESSFLALFKFLNSLWVVNISGLWCRCWAETEEPKSSNKNDGVVLDLWIIEVWP